MRLITRNGNDFTRRFPLAVAAAAALPGRSFLIDGEAICTDDSGLAVFELIRRARHGDRADLIELNREDLRRTPIDQRKRNLAGKLVRRAQARRRHPVHACLQAGSYRSGSARLIAPAAHRIGGRSKIPKRLAERAARMAKSEVPVS